MNFVLNPVGQNIHEESVTLSHFLQQSLLCLLLVSDANRKHGKGAIADCSIGFEDTWGFGFMLDAYKTSTHLWTGENG